MVKFSLKQLKSTRWRLIKTDKDGGFAATVDFTLPEACSNALGDQNKYKHVSRNHVTIDLVREYVDVCEKVSRAQGLEPKEQRQLIKAFTSDIHTRGLGNIPSRLLFTAKTHKDFGNQKARNVHGSRKGPSVPLKRCVCNKTQNVVSDVPHMLKDSIDLVKFLRELDLPSDASFHKGDVDEFSMSGSHRELGDDCAEVADRCAVEFLHHA